MPWLLPLAALSLVLHASTFRWSVEHFGIRVDKPGRPSIAFLWASFALGWGLVLWLFWSADLYGKWLVLFGVPAITVAMVAVFGRKRWQGFREGSAAHAEGAPPERGTEGM